MAFILENKFQYLLKVLSLIYGESMNVDYDGGLTDRVLSRLGESNSSKGLTEREYQLIYSHAEDICNDNPKCNECPVNKFCDKFKKEQQQSYMENLESSLTFVDLFSGIGGASLGFEFAGFSPVLAIDFEKNASSTYKFNRPYMPDDLVLHEDITKILDDPATFSEYVPKVAKSPKALIGGFPCQSFSNANRQRIIDDPRNKLYKYTVKAVSYFKPDVIVLENVVGVKKIVNQIIEDFENIGYFVDFRVFDAYDFGVPQSRKRVIFIGVPYNKQDIDPLFLVGKIFSDIETRIAAEEKFVLKDALYGLRPLEALRIRNNPSYEDEKTGFVVDKPYEKAANKYIEKINECKNHKIIYNHKARFNNDRDIEIFDRLPQGGKSDHPSISDIMPYKNREGVFKDKYFKLIEDRPCRTITAHMKYDCNTYIHPSQARGLTVREAARIQSFPDDFIITGTFQKLYEQVGNSVPPLMSKIIAEAIKENMFQKELICLQ